MTKAGFQQACLYSCIDILNGIMELANVAHTSPIDELDLAYHGHDHCLHKLDGHHMTNGTIVTLVQLVAPAVHIKTIILDRSMVVVDMVCKSLTFGDVEMNRMWLTRPKGDVVIKRVLVSVCTVTLLQTLATSRSITRVIAIAVSPSQGRVQSVPDIPNMY